MSDVQPVGATRPVRTTGGHARSKKVEGAEVQPRDWTIKSLSPETITVSREAARRSGMKINAWVGKALTTAADAGDSTAATGVPVNAREIVSLEHSILKEISELKAQNEHLTQTMNSISTMLIKMYTK